MPETTGHKLRVVVVDDDADVRMLLRLNLTLTHGDSLEIVGEATDGAEAVHVAEQAAPDVIVLDAYMPGTSGLAALPRLRADHPFSRIVLFTAGNLIDLRDRAVEAGADHVYAKTQLDQLVSCVASR